MLFRALILFQLLSLLNLKAQQNAKFEHILPDNGLVNGFINTIYQDSEGFMWFGTFAGLNRYDGYNFYLYEKKNDDPLSLSHNSIYCLLEDKSGFLWIGTENGLDKYSKKENKVYSYYSKSGDTNSLSNNNIRTLYEDHEGNLWIGTYGGGLNQMDPLTGKIKVYKNIPNDNTSIVSNKVNSFYCDRDGNYWIGTEEGGLSTFDKKTGIFKNYHSKYSHIGIKEDVVLKIIEDNNGNIWFGTWYEGLFCYNKENGTFKNYRRNSNLQSISSNTVISLLEDRLGNIWIGTNSGGLDKLNQYTNFITHYGNESEDKNSLSHNIIWSLYQDISGIIWIGTFGGGINKLDPEKGKFTLLQSNKRNKNSLSNNMITSICEDKQGLLWIGTFGGGLNCYNRKTKTFTFYFNNPNSPESIVRKIFEDNHSRLWVSTENGMYIFNKNRTQSTLLAKGDSGFGHFSAYGICEDRIGNLWFGTWTGGLKKLKALEAAKTDLRNIKFETYTNDKNNPNSLPDNVVWDILEDRTGNIWIATSKGIALYDKKKNSFITYNRNNQTNQYEGYNISNIFEDRYGTIWFGSFGYGFGNIVKENQAYNIFNKGNGYYVNEVLAIIEDNKDNLWMSTNNGVIRFEPATRRIRIFDVSDGLQGTLFHKGAYAKLSTGEIAFGGINGLNIFNPDSISSNSYIPPVFIVDIKLFNKSVTLEKAEKGKALFDKPTYTLKEIEFSYDQNAFSIEFAALDYSSPDKTQYQYTLEGFDNGWISTSGSNNSATYTNLKGGDYIFKVKAANKEGIWNNTETTLIIHIIPPFWKSTWFMTMLAIILAFGIFQAYRIRMRIIHRLHEKEKINKEREIIRLKNEKLNSELDFKNKELAMSTMHIIRKNEDITEIKNLLNEIMPLTNIEGKKKMTNLLKIIDSKLDDRSNWEYFEYNFNLIHDNFLKRFTEKYPDINQNDLKICAYIRMNLSTKEMANLLNVSYRTIESTRYRIRKKINIDGDITLNDYIMRF